jgi:hypothetical protein
LSPQSTVHDYFKLFDWDGTLECIHHALYVAVCEQAGREASPNAAIIDSQSAKTAQKGASMDPQGYDAGKKVAVAKSLSLLHSVRPIDRPGRAVAISCRSLECGGVLPWRVNQSSAQLHHDSIRRD